MTTRTILIALAIVAATAVTAGDCAHDAGRRDVSDGSYMVAVLAIFGLMGVSLREQDKGRGP